MKDEAFAKGRHLRHSEVEPPAMGERRARWGYGYQDKVATARILDILKNEIRTRTFSFQGVRLADLEAGRVDDFVLVWDREVQGNSIKWSADAVPLNWGELIGADGLLRQLAEGYSRLSQIWLERKITVRLQSNRPAAVEKHHAQLITKFSVAEFISDHWSTGPSAESSTDVAVAWEKIAQHVGLGREELSKFVQSCEFVLGFAEPHIAGPDSYDLRHYRQQFDDLHKAISTWLSNHPDPELIDRQFLLAAIGFRGTLSGLVQSFHAALFFRATSESDLFGGTEPVLTFTKALHHVADLS
jgi:hypothetical protein